MFTVKNILEAPDAYRYFLDSLVSSVAYFKEAVTDENPTTIRNTDLFIEAWIGVFPELQDYRDLVRSEMKRLNIEPRTEFYYKEGNHYLHKAHYIRIEALLNYFKK